MSDSMGVIIIIGVAIVLIASDFQTIKIYLPFFKSLYKESKKIISEAVAEYFYPLKWLKIRIWNRNLKFRWYSLWIHDKQHESLNFDSAAINSATIAQRRKYVVKLEKYRQLVHKRDLKKS